MNPEVLRPVPKRMITDPETLGRVCWNLANELTGKRWVLDSVRHASHRRSVGEQIGYETYIGDTDILPVENDININFYASKRTVEGYRGNPMDVGSYRITMTVGQSIGESEVPPYVLDEIFESKREDDDEHDEFESVLDDVERDDLDQFDITRELEVTYEITDDGTIETYEQAFTYLIEGEPVHDVTYSSEYGTRVTAPVVLATTGQEVDRRPAMLLYLSDAQLESEVKEIDASWLRFIQEDTLRELASFGAQDQQQHRHQALAMIGLVSSGMYSLQRLSQQR